MIYDQYYLMSLGLAVSWQNPDIQILRNGVPVASAYDLEPATTYEIVATIWNGSTSGVISGMPVSFSYLSFGVQTKSNYIGSQFSVDLGVKGSMHCPSLAHNCMDDAGGAGRLSHSSRVHLDRRPKSSSATTWARKYAGGAGDVASIV